MKARAIISSRIISSCCVRMASTVKETGHKIVKNTLVNPKIQFILPIYMLCPVVVIIIIFILCK